MELDEQSVIEEIERAFDGVRLGEGVSLREADVIDDYGSDAQRKKARSKDELVDWRKISDASISHYSWCLSFFDAEGMRFHLPAYMRFVLKHYETSHSSSIHATLYALGCGGERFGLLNQAQREAVRKFLAFVADSGDRLDKEHARKSLEVWK
jgi:hypothetical protein